MCGSCVCLCKLNNLHKNPHIYGSSGSNEANQILLTGALNQISRLTCVQTHCLNPFHHALNKTAESIVGGLEEKILRCLFHFLLSRGEAWGVNQLATSQLRYKYKQWISHRVGADPMLEL